MKDWLVSHPGTVAAAVALALLWLAEGIVPFFLHRPRAGHALRNIALGVINGLARSLFFPAALLLIAETTRAYSFGLLRSLSPVTAAIAAVLLLDLLTYAWHVASHHWPVLWRFHAVHHHDEAPDSTTALRFHAGDVLIQSLVVLAAAAALGLEVWHILLYEAILIPASLFHHANIRLSSGLDRALGWVIITPRMHWVHHSRWVSETDSNFAGIFSIWDRLFGTLRQRDDPHRLRFGLDGYTPADHTTLRGCLLTPIGPIKSRPGVDTRWPEARALDQVAGEPIRTISRCPLATPEPQPTPG